MSWVDPGSPLPLSSASLSLHHRVTMKPACTYLPWKCPPPNTALAASSHTAERPRSLHVFPERDRSPAYESAFTLL